MSFVFRRIPQPLSQNPINIILRNLVSQFIADQKRYFPQARSDCQQIILSKMREKKYLFIKEVKLVQKSIIVNNAEARAERYSGGTSISQYNRIMGHIMVKNLSNVYCLFIYHLSRNTLCWAFYQALRLPSSDLGIQRVP